MLRFFLCFSFVSQLSFAASAITTTTVTKISSGTLESVKVTDPLTLFKTLSSGNSLVGGQLVQYGTSVDVNSIKCSADSINKYTDSVSHASYELNRIDYENTGYPSYWSLKLTLSGGDMDPEIAVIVCDSQDPFDITAAQNALRSVIQFN